MAGFAATAAVGLAAGVIMTHTQDPGGAEPAPSGVVVGGPEHQSFSIHGDVAGLVPGRRSVLEVTVTNPSSRPIRLFTVTVDADNAGGGCRAGRNLRIGGYHHRRPWTHPVVVPAHGRAIVPLRIRLIDAPHRNQDACQDAAFALHYSGTAGLLHR